MSCHASIATLIVIAIALIFPACIFLGSFRDYCRRIAEIEGKTEENQSIGTDDGGLNRHERGNLSKLMGRYY